MPKLERPITASLLGEEVQEFPVLEGRDRAKLKRRGRRHHDGSRESLHSLRRRERRLTEAATYGFKI